MALSSRYFGYSYMKVYTFNDGVSDRFDSDIVDSLAFVDMDMLLEAGAKMLIIPAHVPGFDPPVDVLFVSADSV